MSMQRSAACASAWSPTASATCLDFLPLMWERYDLVVRRVEYFEPPLQRLFAFTRTELFREHARSLVGYEVANTGAVIFNARR